MCGTGRQLICLKKFNRQCWLVVVVVVVVFCLFVCLLTLRVHAQEGSSSGPVSLSVML